MATTSPQPRSVFLLIDVQDGFLDSKHWGPSQSNSHFEANASVLLAAYRKLLASQTPSSTRHKIIHIQHASTSSSSPLHPSQPGFAFQAFAAPLSNELVLRKSVNSAFIGTNLESVIREHFAGASGKVYLAGLTTDHCVSTTTRMAGNLGVADGKSGEKGEVVFVQDATAAWRKGVGKEWFDAELVHGVHAESLREFATVVETQNALEEWEGWLA